MSHPAQRDFVKLVSAEMNQYFTNSKVLEIGSLDINGSVKDYFSNCDYTGLDISEGKNVDIVCQGQDYDGPDNYFDQVISCEAMEHNPHWVETFQNMLRVCKPGGLVLMTCATHGRKEHGTARTDPQASPLTVEMGWNYYHNLLPSDFKKKLDLEMGFSNHQFWVNWRSFDVYFCGVKKNTDATASVLGWDSMEKSVDAYISQVNKRPVCKYRAFLARLFGDKGFEIIRGFSGKLNLKIIHYIHGG